MCLSPVSSHNVLALKGLVSMLSLIFTLWAPRSAEWRLGSTVLLLSEGCLFGFLHLIMVKCFEISEEHTASVFRVNELVQVDAEVI